MTDAREALNIKESFILSKEAKDIIGFLTMGITLNPGVRMLDMHEDPVYEYKKHGWAHTGTYLYASGIDAHKKPEFKRVYEYLTGAPLPLFMEGETRFGEKLTKGVIQDSEDGSVDHLVAAKGGSPVIVIENIVLDQNEPPLMKRVGVYEKVIETFLA